jgi:hypothetical protein
MNLRGAIRWRFQRFSDQLIFSPLFPIRLSLPRAGNYHHRAAGNKLKSRSRQWVCRKYSGFVQEKRLLREEALELRHVAQRVELGVCLGVSLHLAGKVKPDSRRERGEGPVFLPGFGKGNGSQSANWPRDSKTGTRILAISLKTQSQGFTGLQSV